MVSLRSRKLRAALLSGMLLFSSLPVTAMVQFSDVEARSCSRHGRTCSCPKGCNRADHRHGNAPAIAESAVPACHRTPKATEDSTELPVPAKPDCEIVSCGDGDVSATVASQRPYVPSGGMPSAIPTSLQAGIPAVGNLVPPSSGSPPPTPPPQA